MKCPTAKKQYHCRNDAVADNCLIGRLTNRYMNVYHCNICGDWHLTSRSRNGKILGEIFYIKKNREKLILKIKNM